MQPDSHNPYPQSPTDYLNSIATPAPVKTVNPLLLWGLIGGVLLLGLIIVIAVASHTSGPSSSSLTSVGAKLAALQKLSQSSQKNLQSGELRTVGSSLSLVLTNANHDMVAPLKARKINVANKKEASVKKVTKEFQGINDRLEDARLNGVFDRTYAREMTYALKTLRSDMSVLYSSSNNQQLRTALETTDANIKPLLEGFETFNAS